MHFEVGSKVIVYNKNGYLFEFEDDTHIYKLNGKVIPSNTEILKSFNVGNYNRIPFDTLEHAMLRGKAVHKAIQLYENKTLDPESVHPEVAPYFEQYVAFVRTEAAGQLILSETPIFSVNYNFATTLDQVRKRKGEYSIIEIKTGTNSYKFAKLQTAGQMVALTEQLTGHILEADIDVWQLRRYCLELQPNRYKFYGAYTDDAGDLNEFKSMAYIFNRKRQRGEL